MSSGSVIPLIFSTSPKRKFRNESRRYFGLTNIDIILRSAKVISTRLYFVLSGYFLVFIFVNFVFGLVPCGSLSK